jgi:hypothetical protein
VISADGRSLRRLTENIGALGGGVLWRPVGAGLVEQLYVWARRAAWDALA